MDGIQFVRGEHLSIAKGCYLPCADLLGQIANQLHPILYARPDLKSYLPPLLEVDVFVSWDEDKFLLFVSPEKRAHLPTRGMEMDHLPKQREAGNDLLRNLSGYVDISDLETTRQSFLQLGFRPGFAAAGIFPAGAYTSEANATK